MDWNKLIEKLIEEKEIEKEEFIKLVKENNFKLSMNLASEMGIPIYEMDSKIYLKTNDAIKNNELCFIDIETNGSNGEINGIIEIGAIKYKNGVLLDSFQSYVYAAKVPNEILKLTNIDFSNLKNARSEREVLEEFKKFIKDSTIGAHNLKFDFNFINARLAKNNMQIMKNRSICTLKLAKKTIKTNKYGIKNLNEILGINYPLRHRAYPDALIALNIFHQIMKENSIHLNLDSTMENLIAFIK